MLNFHVPGNHDGNSILSEALRDLQHALREIQKLQYECIQQPDLTQDCKYIQIHEQQRNQEGHALPDSAGDRRVSLWASFPASALLLGLGGHILFCMTW